MDDLVRSSSQASCEAAKGFVKIARRRKSTGKLNGSPEAKGRHSGAVTPTAYAGRTTCSRLEVRRIFFLQRIQNVSNTKYHIDYLQAALQREDDDPLISEYWNRRLRCLDRRKLTRRGHIPNDLPTCARSGRKKGFGAIIGALSLSAKMFRLGKFGLASRRDMSGPEARHC